MHFPALLQFDGDDELEVISSDIEFTQFLDYVQLNCSLVDSNGAVYKIRKESNGQFSAHESTKTMSVEEAVAIAQRHLATLDQCCISKFNAGTVAEVVQALASLDS